MTMRTFKNTEDIRLNVTLRDGREYLDCTLVPHVGFDSNSRMVNFWFGNCMMYIPIDLVKEVAVYETAQC